MGRSKTEKGKVENLKWEEEKLQNEQIIFFFFLAFHFSKPLKFVLSLQKWEFSTAKKYLTLGKKSGKMTLLPLKIIFLTFLHLCTCIQKIQVHNRAKNASYR